MQLLYNLIIEDRGVLTRDTFRGRDTNDLNLDMINCCSWN